MRVGVPLGKQVNQSVVAMEVHDEFSKTITGM